MRPRGTLGWGLDVLFIFRITILSMYVHYLLYIRYLFHVTLPGIYNHTSSSCTGLALRC